MKKLGLLATLLLSSSGFAHAQGPGMTREQISQYVQRLMQVEYAFEQAPPPGISIEAREVARAGTSGANLAVQYHIFVKGVPENTLFKQMVWPIIADKPEASLAGISVGKDGILMCAGAQPDQCGSSKKPNNPVEFVSQPKKGEPTRVVFIAPNLELRLLIVPDPIEAKDKACTLSAIRLTPGFELAYLIGSGYPPNAEVHYQVHIDTTSDQIIHSDAKGVVRFSEIPNLAGKTSGTVQVKITEPTCSPQLSYDVGKG